MKIAEYELPTLWIAALVNDDETGMSDEDSDALARFVADALKTHKTFHCLGPKDEDCEGYFMKYHDAHPYGVLACDVTTVLFDVGE
jgi:hypothetical protein